VRIASNQPLVFALSGAIPGLVLRFPLRIFGSPKVYHFRFLRPAILIPLVPFPSLIFSRESLVLSYVPVEFFSKFLVRFVVPECTSFFSWFATFLYLFDSGVRFELAAFSFGLDSGLPGRTLSHNRILSDIQPERRAPHPHHTSGQNAESLIFFPEAWLGNWTLLYRVTLVRI